MKIAILTELFYPSVGGQEKRYLELSSRLVKLGHTVDIITVRYDLLLPRYESILGVNIIRCADSIGYVRERGLKRSFTGMIKYALSSSLELLASERFDVCIFNQWPLLHIPLGELSSRTRTIIDWCEVWHNKPINQIMLLISLLPDGHMFVADFIKRHFNHIPNDRVQVIPSGVDFKSFYSIERREKGRLIFVGRLERHKCLDLLIKATSIAHQQNKEIKLDIVGSGPLQKNLMLLCKSRDFIKIHGRVTEDKKVSLLKRSWAFALTSEREGFPIAVCEAMAAGLPIITTNSQNNGARCICRDYGCGIISPPDEEKVAEGIIKLYEDEGLYGVLSKAATKAAKSFDWDISAELLNNFLHRLVS